jgi:SNF2 family DNA or RNA helicase
LIVDWTSDPWDKPEPKVVPPLEGLSKIAGSKLPPPLQESVKRLDFSYLSGSNSAGDYLSAIAKAEILVERSKGVKAELLKQSDIARRIRDNARKAYEHAKQYADVADNNFRTYGYKVNEFENDLKGIRQMYADFQTRMAESEALATELEFYEMISQEKAWGDRMLKHQKVGAFQMAFEKRCILADQMGLGKTLQAIMAMDLRQAKRVLILAPNDILSNFAREITYWTTDKNGKPSRNVIALGTMKNKHTKHMMLKQLRALPEFTVLMNYEAWRRDPEIIKLLIDLEFEMVILDEAHNLKDEKSGAAIGATKIIYAENQPYACKSCDYKFTRWPYSSMCPSCQYEMEREPYARNSVKYVFPMTGTAILNSPEELWKLLNLLDNQAFADKTQFLKHYCKQQEFLSLTGNTYVKRWVFQSGGADMLFRKMGPKIIRRTRETAGIEIPPQGEQIHELEFEEGEYLKQRAIYNDMMTYGQIFMQNREVLTASHVITIINRLRQVITMPSGIKLKDPDTGKIYDPGVEESIKVDYAEKLALELLDIDEETGIARGERCVVFSQFVEPLEVLARRLKEKGVRVALYSSTEKPEILDAMARDFDIKFTAPGEHKYDVILGTYKKMGKGLNLVGATQVIQIDEEWNPGLNDQGTDRVNRIGQKKETTRHILRVGGTIDMGMARLLGFKKDIVSGFEKRAEEVSPIDILEDILSGGNL